MSFPDPSALNAARSGPFFVVINAGAGHHNADDAQQVMARVFRQAGREVAFFPVGKTEPISAVARRAVALAQERQGVVVAAGGDGTINAVASAVFASGCPFGVLPQGTFNYFGRANGISQDIEAAATALLNARILPVQAGQVNGRIFLVNASVGLYPQLLEDREAWKRRFGRSRLVAFISGMATLLQARKQLHLLIESGGRVTALRTPTLFVGNNDLQLAQVGIDEQQVHSVHAGELAGIVVKPIGTLALFGLLLRGLAGRLGDADSVDSFSFRRLTITPKGRKRIKVATDGEVVWMQAPLVFEVAGQALLLMVPAPADRVEVA